MHHQELATILLNYHIGRIVLRSMCVGISVWLRWSDIRVAGNICSSFTAHQIVLNVKHLHKSTHRYILKQLKTCNLNACNV